MNNYRYIDLFAGGGGLSEGFVRQGFSPVAHIECDKASCFTLKTRTAFYYLLREDNVALYHSYIRGEVSRTQLYSSVPQNLLDSVINAEIGPENGKLFSVIDSLLDDATVDLIIGGPPCQAYSRIGRPKTFPVFFQLLKVNTSRIFRSTTSVWATRWKQDY